MQESKLCPAGLSTAGSGPLSSCGHALSPTQLPQRVSGSPAVESNRRLESWESSGGEQTWPWLRDYLAGLRERADGKEKRSAGPGGENARVSLCRVASGLSQAPAAQLQAASPARCWEALLLLLFSALLLPPPARPFLSSCARQDQASAAPRASGAVRRRTASFVPGAGARTPRGAGRPPMDLHAASRVPSPPCLLLWFCCPLRLAPRSALTFLSLLSCPPRPPIPSIPLPPVNGG